MVIPHHSRRALLQQALASVSGLPVFVVDDSASGVGELSGATVLRAGGRGFAGAVNMGLARAQADGFDLALLLNDDAAVEPGCVQALVAALQPEVGAAGPVLMGPHWVESAGLSYSERSARLKQRTQVPQQVTDVHALSGACLLVRTQERFDLAYRHGMEDVALCRRMRTRGQAVRVVPTARCRHLGGGSLDRRSREATRHALSGHLRLAGSSRLRRALVLGYALGQVVREGGPVARLGGLREGWRDGRGR